MEAEPMALCRNQCKMGITGGGPVCCQTQSPASKVLQLRSRPISRGSGRLSSELEKSETLRISPIQPSREVPEENSSGESPDSSNNSTSLAGSIMVSSPAGKHSRLSCTPPTLSSDVGESNGPSSPSGTEQLLRLAAWRVSGDPCRLKEFQRRHLKSYPRHGDNQQKSRIPQPGKSGWAGVRNGIWIHFQSV